MSLAITERERRGSRLCLSPQAESWFHSPDFDSQYRRRRAQQRAWFQRKAETAEEIVADPDDYQPSLVRARNRYFDPDSKPRRRGNPCQELPKPADLESVATQVRPRLHAQETDLEYLKRLSELAPAQPSRTADSDLRAFADIFIAHEQDTYKTEQIRQRLAQAEEMQIRGLGMKAKRLLLCSRIGRRVNCTGCEEHKFFQPYLCRCRYCENCGPFWFRQKFADLLAALEPVAEHLLHAAQGSGRKMVVAKLDFTVRNTFTMPTPEFVRKFHADRRRFFRAMEKHFGISRKEYGFAGCDEFGGNNSNLHMHCVYFGPYLPQRAKELSHLWSKIRGERSFISIKRAKSFSAALAHALKYPAKFLDASTPKRLAELEATFHRTRRFSAGGAFHNVKLVREPGQDSLVGECPLCGAPLVEVVEPWQAVFMLAGNERRSNVDEVRRHIAKAKVLSGCGP